MAYSGVIWVAWTPTPNYDNIENSRWHAPPPPRTYICNLWTPPPPQTSSGYAPGPPPPLPPLIKCWICPCHEQEGVLSHRMIHQCSAWPPSPNICIFLLKFQVFQRLKSRCPLYYVCVVWHHHDNIVGEEQEQNSEAIIQSRRRC